LFSLEVEEEVSKTFRKLLKKDRKQLEAINKKIQQILDDPFQQKRQSDKKPIKRIQNEN